MENTKFEKCCSTCKNAMKCARFIPIDKNEGGCDQYKEDTAMREFYEKHSKEGLNNGQA